VLLEGAALLPELVYPLLPDPRRYIAIVPSASFQLEHYQKREWKDQWLSECSDPEKAFDHWMERDIGFAGEISRQAAAARASCDSC